MWSEEQDEKILTVYHIAPCSREQTWIQIYLTKHPIIIRMNYTLTSRAEVLNVSLGMFLFPYHLIFTAVLYLQPFSIRFEHLACFGSVLCCLVFNSDSKANDWWLPCAYFGCVWHLDRLPGNPYLPNTLNYLVMLFLEMRIKTKEDVFQYDHTFLAKAFILS